jgi:hypothetical protein
MKELPLQCISSDICYVGSKLFIRYDPGKFIVVITSWSELGDIKCGLVVEKFVDKNIVCVK